jgi:L-lactate dehydrogenase complex protein LldE
MLADKLANLKASGADTLVACDMGCLMHLGGAIDRQGLGIRTRHLAQVLDSEGE